MAAAASGDTAALRAALSADVDSRALLEVDERGRSALDWARAARRKGAVRLLEQAAADTVAVQRARADAAEAQAAARAVVAANARASVRVLALIAAKDYSALLAMARAQPVTAAALADAVEVIRVASEDLAALGAGAAPGDEQRGGAVPTVMAAQHARAMTARAAERSAAMAAASATAASFDSAGSFGGGAMASPPIAQPEGSAEPVRAPPPTSAAARRDEPLGREMVCSIVPARARGQPVEGVFCFDLETRDGWTAMALAALAGDVTLVSALMDVGANTRIETVYKHTALTWAAATGHTAVVACLLRRGASARIVTSERRTALMHACARGNVAIAMELLAVVCTEALTRLDVGAVLAGAAAEAKVVARGKSLQGRAAGVSFVTGGDPASIHSFLAGVHGDSVVDDGTAGADDAPGAGGESEDGITAGALAAAAGMLEGDCMAEVQEYLYFADVHGKTAFDLARAQGDGDALAVLASTRVRLRERLQVQLGAAVKLLPRECRRKCGWVGDRLERDVHESIYCRRRIIECPLGCPEHMQAREAEAHCEGACTFRLTKCARAHLGCTARAALAKIGAHEDNLCEYRPIDCPLECGHRGRYDEVMRKHVKHSCPQRYTRCDDCGTALRAFELSKHYMSLCPRRFVFCVGVDFVSQPERLVAMEAAVESGEVTSMLAFLTGKATDGGIEYGCGAVMRLDELQAHIKETCSNRAFPCMYCGAMLAPAYRREAHEAGLCGLRPADCPHACGVSGLRAMDVRHHADDVCELRPLACTLACGATILARDMRLHTREGMEGECVRRRVHCGYDLVGQRLRLRVSTFRPRVEPGQEFSRDPTVPDAVTVAAAAAAATALGPVPPLLDAAVLRSDGGPRTAVSRTSSWAPPAAPPIDPSVDLYTWRLAVFKSYDGRARLYRARIDGVGVRWVDLKRWECELVDERSCVACCGIFAAEDVDKHMESCGHAPVPCPNRCPVVLQRSAVDAHVENVCRNRKVPCARGCGERPYEFERFEHEEGSCRLKPRQCVCGLQVPLQLWEGHTKNECTWRTVSCPIGCGETILFVNKESHETGCINRKVQCPNRCGASDVTASELAQHLEVSCLARLVPCTHGCGMHVIAAQLPAHISYTCTWRIVACPNACGARHCYKDAPDHVPMCPERMTLCSAGCGRAMRAREVEAHVQLDCPRVTVPCSHKCGAIVQMWRTRAHERDECPNLPVSCPNECGAIVWRCEMHAHIAICPQQVVCCAAVGAAFERTARAAGMLNTVEELVRARAAGVLSRQVAYVRQVAAKELLGDAVPARALPYAPPVAGSEAPGAAAAVTALAPFASAEESDDGGAAVAGALAKSGPSRDSEELSKIGAAAVTSAAVAATGDDSGEDSDAMSVESAVREILRNAGEDDDIESVITATPRDRAPVSGRHSSPRRHNREERHRIRAEARRLARRTLRAADDDVMLQEAIATGEYVPSPVRPPAEAVSPRTIAATRRGNLLSCLKDVSGGVDAALSGCFMKLADWMAAPPLHTAVDIEKHAAGAAAVGDAHEEAKDGERSPPTMVMPGPGGRRPPVFGVRPADQSRCVLRTCPAHGDSPLLRAAARGDV